MDNKVTVIMASALVAILLTATVANQAFASPLPLAKLKDALGAVKGDLSALFGGGGSGGGGSTGGIGVT